MSNRVHRSRAARALFAAALIGASLVAPAASAQSSAPSASRPFVAPKRGFLTGTVGAAESFELEQVERVGGKPNGVVRFSIAVILDAAPTEPFPLEDARAETGTFTPTCKRYYAIFSGPPAADVKSLVGKTVRGAVSLDPIERDADKENLSSCLLLDSLDRVIPKAKRETFNLWRLSDTPSTLDQLKRARAVFEPDVTSVKFYDQTPIDSAIEYALRDMKSREALELAVEMRMFSAIQLNATWENDPESYPLFEKVLVGGADDAHPYLEALFWHASSTRARAKVAELATSRPELAASILRTNAGWVGASTLLEELVDAGRLRLGYPDRLLGLGTEDAFLEKHRTDSAPFAADIDGALGASKERRELGITDGWSLVRWIAKNKKTPRHDKGMRVTLIGQKALCCDMRGLVSDDVDFEVRVGCDAEQRRAYCDAKAVGAVTATGVVKSAQYTTHRLKPGAPDRPIVRIELETATVVDGGEVPAPASLESAPVVAAPAEPAPSGCGCQVGGESRSEVLGALVVVAGAGVVLSRRRTSPGRSGGAARANPARGRAG